jgi:tellurium resistance protein TerD
MGRFNLNKGERFKLDKDSGLNLIQVDLGWKSGADLDASAFLLGEDGAIMDDADFVFYNSENRNKPFDRSEFGNKKNWKSQTCPMSKDGSVMGSIDDLGDGDEEEGEDAGETMHVDLSKVNPKITEIVFIVTIYHGDEEGTTFGKVREPFISITNEETGDELCRFDLKDKFSSETAVVAGSLICDANGDWSFEAQGKGYDGGMQTLIDIYA